MTRTFDTSGARDVQLRQRLLARRLKGTGRRAADKDRIIRADRGAPLPLSNAQRRLWFLDRLQPGGAEYNVSSVVRLTGRLDRGALRRALSDLVARHEILRTRYASCGTEPCQIIDPPAPVALAVVDLRVPRAPSLTDAVDRFVCEPFELAAGPMLRVLLFREEDERHVLTLCLHHIACDGWSWPILWRDLRTLYEAYSAGVTPDLPEPGLQYADFARWQHAQERSQRTMRDLAYWRHCLAGLRPVRLPADRPRPVTWDARGDTVSFDVAPPVGRAVCGYGQERGATPFQSMLTAVAVLLSRITDRTDVAVGMPVTGRSRPELEEVVGFFVNTEVVRTDLSGEADFGELVRRTCDRLSADYDHQDLPFETLVHELAPDRDPSGTPLVPVVFAFYEAEPQTVRMGELTVTNLPVPFTGAKFDLVVSLNQRADGGCDGVLQYRTALYDRQRMTDLATQFTDLLAEIAARPRVLACGCEDPAPAAPAAAAAAERVPPDDELELAVLRLWQDLLGGTPIGVTDSFFRVGGHSLLAVSLVDRLESDLGQRVGIADVFRAPTVRALSTLLRERPGDLPLCIVPMSPGRAGTPPLILAPPTGGTPLAYLALVQELDPGLPVLGLQAVGFAGEDPLASIEEIADRYAEEIVEVVPDGPIRLAGWSMGGVVAFETAARLEGWGRRVANLCVIDAGVLGLDALRDPMPRAPEDDALTWFGQAVLGMPAARLPGDDRQVVLAELLAEARHRGLVSAVAGSEVIDRMARIYLANKRATQAYRCLAQVDSDIHLIRSTDAHPTRGRLEVRPESWQRHTRGVVRTTEVPGDHWSIAEPPHVSALARAVMCRLGVGR